MWLVNITDVDSRFLAFAFPEKFSWRLPPCAADHVFLFTPSFIGPAKTSFQGNILAPPPGGEKKCEPTLLLVRQMTLSSRLQHEFKLYSFSGSSEELCLHFGRKMKDMPNKTAATTRTVFRTARDANRIHSPRVQISGFDGKVHGPSSVLHANRIRRCFCF